MWIAGNLVAGDRPKVLGYTFPDEWEERRGTMMIFPAEHQYGRQTKGLREEFVSIHPGDYSIDWARDTAPIVFRGSKGEPASAGFRFNGWGKKYRGWQEDVGSRARISKAMNWPILPSELVLEGRAIEIGGGTINRPVPIP